MVERFFFNFIIMKICIILIFWKESWYIGVICYNYYGLNKEWKKIYFYLI